MRSLRQNLLATNIGLVRRVNRLSLLLLLNREPIVLRNSSWNDRDIVRPYFFFYVETKPKRHWEKKKSDKSQEKKKWKGKYISWALRIPLTTCLWIMQISAHSGRPLIHRLLTPYRHFFFQKKRKYSLVASENVHHHKSEVVRKVESNHLCIRFSSFREEKRWGDKGDEI